MQSAELRPRPLQQRSFWTVWRSETQAAVVTAIMCTAVFLVVVLSRERNVVCRNTSPATKASSTAQDDLRSAMRELVDTSYIDALVKTYSLEPHIAGSERNTLLANDVASKLRSYGFDDVRSQVLPVMLSNVSYRRLGRADPRSGAVVEDLNLDEDNVAQQQQWSKALPPTNGFSGSGKAVGPLVWANYGRREDFDAIAHINLTGCVVVVRYRKIFRGDKVKYAARRGAVGVVIVHDPADMVHGAPYPAGPWANNATVQRGSVSLTEGDALTPTWPSEFNGPTISVKDVFNESVMGEGMALPTIPVQPIGYGNAHKLMQGIGNGVNPLPSSWQNTGFLALLSNGIGPGPAAALIEVQRELVSVNITNVFGVIVGREEPDRTVLFGSHRDAWTYGAADPISGHSIMLEVARTIGELKRARNWRPRRSIQFCSWDAEEWSIIGSVEYVETTAELLRQRAVAYLNLDVGVRGSETMYVNGSPLMTEVLRMIGAEVLLPNGAPIASIMQPLVPPGSGTDHVGFVQLAGVPILDCGLDNKDSSYEAVYHSNYDNYDWMARFGDPGFVFHAVMAQFQGSVLLALADADVLPLHVEDYAASVATWIGSYAGNPANSFADFAFLQQSVDLLLEAAANFAQKRQQWSAITGHHEMPFSASDVLSVRSINDMSSGLERVFLGRGQLETGQPWYLHVIFTPSAADFYSGSTMPLIGDALASRDAKTANFALGRVAQFIRRAALYLTDPLVMPPRFSDLLSR